MRSKRKSKRFAVHSNQKTPAFPPIKSLTKIDKLLRDYKPNFIKVLGQRMPATQDKKIEEADTKVLTTTNYGQFTFLKSNRAIDENHVYRLMKLIKAEGHQKEPVIVNEKLEVISGQHRIKACEKLGMRVTYIIVPGLTIKDAREMNNSQKPWSFKDHLRCYGHSSHYNYQAYKQVASLIEEYPSLSNAVALVLLSPKNYVGAYYKFKLGTFAVEDYEFARKQASYLAEIRSSQTQKVKFAVGWLKIIRMPTAGGGKFSMITAIKHVKNNIRLVENCGPQNDWTKQLMKAYGKGLSTRNKLTNTIVS
jgi:hypothetical protein|tara:strand:+ start:265 stop:1185 length:921 start_codon:yes stop_codon:yes gene_type:complete